MASSKDSKTSKTAHVMNLLSKNRSTEPAAEQPAAAPQQAEAPQSAAPAAAQTPAPAPAAPIPPIISSINADAAVSSQIRDALEASLGQTEPAQPAAPAPAASSAPAAPSQTPAPQAEAVTPAPEPQAPQAEAPAAAPAAVSQPDPAPAVPEEPERPAYINVMQVLVEEKAEKYMRLSGVCCCDTCMVDVKAYALNHLPPKYVVMTKGEMIPKLTFYEVQHSSDITTQLMRACEVIAKAPHHGRE